MIEVCLFWLSESCGAGGCADLSETWSSISLDTVQPSPEAGEWSGSALPFLTVEKFKDQPLSIIQTQRSSPVQPPGPPMNFATPG